MRWPLLALPLALAACSSDPVPLDSGPADTGPVQVDIGFGDAITPAPKTVTYPTLLDDLAAPSLRAYPVYTVIAEKLHAMVVLGMNNSRMKDFFDLHWLSQHQSFNGTLLCDSVRATFERRKTAMPTDPPDALTTAFSSDPGKITQWDAFRRKGRLDAPELPEIIARLSRFLTPLLYQEAQGQIWHPGTGWTESPS